MQATGTSTPRSLTTNDIPELVKAVSDAMATTMITPTPVKASSTVQRRNPGNLAPADHETQVIGKYHLTISVNNPSHLS